MMKIRTISKALVAIGSLSLCGMFTLAALPKDTKLAKINKKRIPQDLEQARRCIHFASDSPHGPNELNLFVNDVVIEYRKKNPRGHEYPAGSIFVKNKYYPGEKEPYSRTIMVKKKKEAGKEKAKPSVTDWEFSSESLPSGKKEKMTKTAIQHCMTCHDNFDDTGYVSKRSEFSLLELLKIDPKNDPEKSKAGK